MPTSFITKFLITLFISIFGLIFSAGAWAQAWPTKPIKFVVPYPPGGGTDVIARIVQEPMSQALGQQIIIDNRGGAGGSIGTDAVAKSPADGYTVLFIKAGKLRALAVSTTKRSVIFPVVPTMAESGFKDFEVDSWYAMFVPAGTPKPIIDTLYNAVVKVLAQPAVKEKLLAQGAEAVGSTPAQLGVIVKTELVKWAKVAKESGIKAE